jgi:hypothetical protein
VNAAFLVMSSALASGGDVVPAGWGERPLPVVQAGGCCTPGPTVPPPSGCCDAGRTKLLDRLKSKFGAKQGSDCCDPCPPPKYYQPNLLDKMKDRWGAKKSCGCTDACPAPACGPACGPTPVPVPNDPPNDVPKDMKPKPEPEPVKKGGNGGPAVAPSPVPLPPLPAAPLSAPKLSGTTSPY